MFNAVAAVFMTPILARSRNKAQCHDLGLSHTFRYAPRHGTSPIALFRDSGRRREYQPSRTEGLSDSARVESADKGFGRVHRSTSARPTASLDSSHSCRTNTSEGSARTHPQSRA